MMGWATGHIERLRKGETVSFRPRGSSMVPLVKSGQLVTVEPMTKGNYLTPGKGDIVLCRVHGSEYLHLVKALRIQGGSTRYQIGNNCGGVNGWVGIDSIFGRLVEKN